MPAYVRRPHDELLRAVLDPAVPASRLVVVRGGSSTGKTRAAYEAVAGRLADWQLDYPLDPGALAARLEAGVPPRTVLWLGELRQYADADGGAAVLGRLADLLNGEGHLVITTVWPEQWTAYTAAARAGPGARRSGRGGRAAAGAAARAHRRRPGRDRSGPRRGHRRPGRVHRRRPGRRGRHRRPGAGRSGGGGRAPLGRTGRSPSTWPGSLTCWTAMPGRGGDPYGQAVITAAMDATRLGHASPLPAALIQEAAVGYLTGPQRTRPIATWRDTALAWAAEELSGAVRALQPVPPPDGTGVAGYQVADYLDQHGRRTRQDQLGPASLWDALTAHTDTASDLIRLGAGRARPRPVPARRSPMDNSRHPGQRRRRRASSSQHLRQQPRRHHPRRPLGRRPGQPRRPGWPSLTCWGRCATAGASEAVTTLAARAAAQVSLDDPGAVAGLLGALREAGASGRGHDPGRPGRRPGHASTTRRPSPRCWVRCTRPGPADAATTLAGPGRRPGQPRRPGGRRRPAAARRCATAGERRGHHPAGPRPRRPRQPRRPGGVGLPAGGAARRRGQATRSPPWPPGPPPRSASTTRGPSAALLGALRDGRGQRRGHHPGRPGRRPGQPRRPGGRRRAAGGAARGRGQRTRSPPCWPGPPPTSASTTRRPSPGCWGRCARPGTATRSPPWPARPPPMSASTTRGPSPACWGRCARPGTRKAVTTLAARAAAQASLDDPGAVAGLLWVLRDGRGQGRGHRLAGP